MAKPPTERTEQEQEKKIQKEAFEGTNFDENGKLNPYFLPENKNSTLKVIFSSFDPEYTPSHFINK